MQKLNYPKHPIYSIKSLALLLSIDEIYLQQISNNSNSYFQLNPQIKKDGSKRDCYNLKKPLKDIHKKIKNKITSKVIFPDYIQGSIKGRSNITNARLHEKPKVIIKLDIKNFFPSISHKHICNLWRYFFNFSEEVSKLLTNIITLNDKFIQGSPLSSDIANLLFYDNEYKLVKYFEEIDLIYSRYVDDINISSKEKISNNLKTTIIKQIDAMLKSKGLNLNHKKTKILNDSNQMLVTGLVVNESVKVSQNYIDSTYKEIKNNPNINSIKGKINYIKQTTPKKAINVEKAHNKSFQRTASTHTEF